MLSTEVAALQRALEQNRKQNSSRIPWRQTATPSSTSVRIEEPWWVPVPLSGLQPSCDEAIELEQQIALVDMKGHLIGHLGEGIIHHPSPLLCVPSLAPGICR